jgi:quercetin dioxygenase-like cupin family protein
MESAMEQAETDAAQPSNTHPVVLGPGEGQPVSGPFTGNVTFKITGAESGGSLSVIESTIPPEGGPPLHRHPDMVERIYALGSELLIQTDADQHRTPAGSFFFIPRGLTHACTNAGTGPARFLGILTLAGLEHFFRRLAEQRAALGIRRAIAEGSRHFGIELLGPPLAD